MYFITDRNSETGKKFEVLAEKMENAKKLAWEFAEKYGFKALRMDRFSAVGGISSLADPETVPDPKIWKGGEVRGEFMPRLTSKEGKLINKEIQELPTIGRTEPNECVGFDGSLFRGIGFQQTNEKYFGFSLSDDWVFTPPEDCEEVTITRYKELFPK